MSPAAGHMQVHTRRGGRRDERPRGVAPSSSVHPKKNLSQKHKSRLPRNALTMIPNRRVKGLLFYFLLKTDEGVGWWLRRAGGRFPPSLIRYREIGFFFSRDRLFLRGNFFFRPQGCANGGWGGRGEGRGGGEGKEEEGAGPSRVDFGRRSLHSGI